eukprot:gb/GECG01015784.1/.p1 GENE.gb/GECG01015784.1/~~gb/GECG01015784.1/.p1  ORF type:complete len:1546 (+),score=351.24 gb/GECG01015784.1/:1-4638(+)
MDVSFGSDRSATVRGGGGGGGPGHYTSHPGPLGSSQGPRQPQEQSPYIREGNTKFQSGVASGHASWGIPPRPSEPHLNTAHKEKSQSQRRPSGEDDRNELEHQQQWYMQNERPQKKVHTRPGFEEGPHTEARTVMPQFNSHKRDLVEPEYNDSLYRERFEALRAAYESRIHSLASKLEESLHKVYADEGIPTMKRDDSSSQFVQDRIHEIIVEAFHDEKENVISRLMESNANKESHIAGLEQELDGFRMKYHRDSARHEQEKQHWEVTTSESYDRLLETQRQTERQLSATVEELNEAKRQSSKYYSDKEYWRQQCNHLEARLQHVRESADNVSSTHKDTFQREYNMQQQIKQLQAQLKREQKNHEVTASKFDEALSTAEELEQRVREKDSRDSELSEAVHERNKLRGENKNLRYRLEEWQKDYSALQQELSDTQKQLRDVEQARDQLQSRYIDMGSRVEQLANSETHRKRQYVEQLNEQLHETQQAKQDLELQVEEQNAKLQRMDADVKRKTEQLNSLQDEKADLTSRLEESKELTRKLEQLNEENASHKERESQLQARCNDLSQRLSDSQYALSEAKVSHQQELLNLRSELDQEKDDLRSQLHEKYDTLLKDTTKSLEQQISELAAARDAALEKASNAIGTEQHRSEIEQVRREEQERISNTYEETLHHEREVSRKEAGALKEQLGGLRDSNERLHQQLNEAQASARTYQQENENMKERLNEVERQLEETETQLEEERNRHQQLQEQLRYKERDVNEKEAQADLLTHDEFEKKVSELESLQQQVGDYQVEMDNVEQDRKKWRTSYEQIHSLYENAREENSSLHQKFSDLEEKCNHQTDLIETLRTELSEKSAETRRAMSQMEIVNSEKSRLEREVKDKQEKLEQATAKLSDYDTKLHTNTFDSYKWIVGEVARLRSQFDALRKSAEDELEFYQGFCSNQFTAILRNQPAIEHKAVYKKAKQMLDQWREEEAWRKEMQVSHAVQREKEQFTREKEELKEQLEHLKAENDKLSVSHNFLQQRIMNCIRSANRWLSQESQVSEDHTDPECSIEVLEGATGSLCRILESYKHHNSQMQGDYEHLTEELKKYESSTAAYEERLQSLAHTISSVCSLPHQAMYALTEASTEESFNQELHQISLNLSEKMKNGESTNAQLQEHVSQLQSQLESHRSTLAAEREELNKTREQLFESERYAAKIQVELSETKSNLETSNARIEALKKSVEEKDTRINKIQEELKEEYGQKIERLEESLNEEREQHENTKQKMHSQSSMSQEEIDKQVEEMVQQKSEHFKSQLEETKRRLDRSNSKTHKLREELLKTARDADETITQERYLREEKERELKSAKSKLMRTITKLKEKDEKLSNLKESLHTIRSRLRTYQESSDQLASSNSSQGRTIGSLQAILQRSLDTLSPENINSAQQLSENTERLKSKVYRQPRNGRRTSGHSRRSSASIRRGSQESDSTGFLKSLGEKDSTHTSSNRPLEESRYSHDNAQGNTAGMEARTFTSQLPEEALRSTNSESFITDSTIPAEHHQESAGSLSEGEL